MNGGLSETLFAIDKAENDTSVWSSGWVAGTAAVVRRRRAESGRRCRRKGLLKPVDLLAVGHRERNATPPAAILDEVR
jgi:hypothetical protein